MRLLRRDPDKGYLDAWLWVPKRHMNAEGTKQALTFTLSTDRAVTVLQLWKETVHHILVPREFYDITTLPFEVVDCRPKDYPQVTIRSRIKLDHRPVNGVLTPTGETIQQEALDAMLAARGGILQLACGRGKTVDILELIARLGVPALIAIDNTQLLEQWKKEIEDKLDIPDGVGLIQGSVFDWQKPIVLTTYHTLSARAATLPEEVRRWFGIFVGEEGHHIAAPTFSRCVDVVYGRRLIITATPTRDDGMHLVYNFHIGGVLYKNLTPETVGKIFFVWTGFALDLTDPAVAMEVNAKNGEFHLKKLAGFFGRNRARLDYVIRHVQQMVDNGRHPLILSESVDEVVNLLALWTKQPTLYSDIPDPTPKEVAGLDAQERQAAQEKLLEIEEKLQHARTPKQKADLEERRDRLKSRLAEVPLTPDIHPGLLTKPVLLKLWKNLREHILPQLRDSKINPVKRRSLERKAGEIRQQFGAHAMAKAVARELYRRQRAYIHALLEVPSNAGILIEEVDVAKRLDFVKSKQVLFSIAKYGREGLDNPEIDTALVSDPFSSRNNLQQLLGRPSRRMEGKRVSVVVFLEDDIGPVMGMCRKLRQHLREWPSDEGGPFAFEMVGHPHGKKKKTWNNEVRPMPTGVPGSSLAPVTGNFSVV